VTLLDIITDALFEIGSVGVGEPVSPEDAAIGLRVANRMLSNWSAERLSVYAKRFDQILILAGTDKFSLGRALVSPTVTPWTPTTTLNVANQAVAGQSVTLRGATGAWAGLNGTYLVNSRTDTTLVIAFDSHLLTSPITGTVYAEFNCPRPVSIESANFINANGESFDLEPMSSQSWSREPDKSASGRVVRRYYLESSYPLATIYLLPTTTQSGCKIEIWSWVQLVQFDAVTDTFDLPPGYEAAVVMNLAIDLAAAYGRQVSPSTAARAAQYKTVIQGVNPPPAPGIMQEALVSQPPTPQPQPQAEPQR
jgi:hypothetical protein